MDDLDLKDFMKETRQSHLEMTKCMARVEEGQKNLLNYVGAVSKNNKDLEDKVDEHMKDDGAHGIKTTKAVLGSMMGLMTLIFGAVETWRLLLKK